MDNESNQDKNLIYAGIFAFLEKRKFLNELSKIQMEQRTIVDTAAKLEKIPNPPEVFGDHAQELFDIAVSFEKLKDSEINNFNVAAELHEKAHNQQIVVEEVNEKLTTFLYYAAFISPPEQSEAMIGDMEEKFYRRQEKFGTERAMRLLKKDLILSARHFIIGLARSKIIQFLTKIGLYQIYKHFTG